MSEIVKISVNGEELEAPKGGLLIDTLLDEKIHIPHFCYHQALGKDGNCRMCMVEIEGQKRPQIACDTPIKDGMIVRTKGENIEKVRRDILELELINHPIDCPTCDQAGECKLQDYYMQSGFYESRVNVDSKNNARKRVDLGANVMLDQERCVLCTRCVRFCSDITGTNELGVINRADHSVIGTFPGRPLSNPYAMNVVDLCPVGALTSKDFRFKQRVWFLETFDAICNGCSKGCNIHVDHRKEKYKDDQIFRFRPKVNKSVNGHFICDEGRLSYHEENKNRFLTPIVDSKESTLENSLAAMFKLIATNENILFIVSPNLSCEELQNINSLASLTNSSVSGYSPNYIDNSFGDDYLKKSDKSANRSAFKEYNINEDEDDFNNKLNNATLVVIFDNNYFDENLTLLDNKKVVTCFSHNCLTIRKSNVAIPVSSFYEKSGTYINCDGIKQKVVSKMNKENPALSVTSLLEELKSMVEKGNI
ncbi:NADH-quinone oxidoreductase subunit G [Malaciobacter molluscorum LMG 25693]|uniref:NADH-quinone oxidoreductase subunit G n=1 Tax=Malaciobacter molluscorum LMG 25693 TaxID=870501 RepID=A0A2G1DHI6_9BACT|nr:2Fe-2S iron-sulfur cluster-binding protein [Malaciobacter molluscorum]AXX93298.1 NADH:quinone oxidoreductase I, chain G [Malaciobacter molluscorum LMG 25693]PHO17955.1 NADH-quinone oxidoreductase subunit G [Malaciobacter molluscorum LMG 25693]